MKVKRLFKCIGIAALAGIAIVLGIFLTGGIPVSLDRYRSGIEEAFSSELNRETVIKGEMHLHLSMTPTLRLTELEVHNPEGWDGRTERVAVLERFESRIALGKLFQRQLEVLDLEIEGLAVTLEEAEDGRSNWSDSSGPGDEDVEAESGVQLVGLRKLEMEDLVVEVFSADTGEPPSRYNITRVQGNAEAGEGMNLQISGEVRSEVVRVSLTSGPLEALLDPAVNWNYEASGTVGGIDFQGKGGVRSLGSTGEDSLEFEIVAEDLRKVEAFLESTLPPFPDLKLSGRLSRRGSEYHLENLEGVLGDTGVRADLEVDVSDSMPEVNGTIQFDTLDMAVFASEGEKKDVDRKSGVSYPVTGEVRIEIGELVNPRASVRDLVMDCAVAADSMNADLEVNLAGVDLKGPVELATTEEGGASFAINLEGEDSEIAGLYEFYTGDDTVSGPFSRVRYSISNSGINMADAWAGRRTELDVADASLTKQLNGKEVAFELEEGEIRAVPGTPDHHYGKGIIRGAPFEVHYILLEPEKAPEGVEPFMDLAGVVSGADILFRGVLSRDPAAPKPPREIRIVADRIGTLAPLVGISESSELPLRIEGTYLSSPDGWRIDDLTGELGSSNLSGRIASVEGPDSKRFAADLDMDVVSVAEIETLIGEKEETPETADSLDQEVLPTNLKVDDLDLDLRIEELLLGWESLSGLSFSTRVRDGRMPPSEFELSLGTNRFEGVVSADFSDDSPEFDLELTSTDLDAGALLADLELTTDTELSFQRTRFHLQGRGATLRESLIESDMSLTLSDGTWILRDANTGARLPVMIDEGEISSGAGENLDISLLGTLGDTPLSLALETDAHMAVAKESETCDLAFKASLAGTEIDLSGIMALPLEQAELDLDLKISGEDMSSLNSLLSTDLPPLQSYDVRGRFRVEDSGYSLSGMSLKVGQSDLRGSLAIDTTVSPTSVAADLTTPFLQLEDFIKEDWTARDTSSSVPPPDREDGIDLAGINEDLGSAQREINKLLSFESLNKLDADIRLVADRVGSGPDRMGRGEIDLDLAGGQLDINSIRLDLPQGKVALSYQYHPGSAYYDGKLRLEVENLDYGYLARRKSRSSKAGGILDVDLDISGQQIPIDQRLIQKGSGHISFLVQPRNLEARIFDLWATNLLVALIPEVDPRKQSKVNYVIGELELNGGKLSLDQVIIDTTKVRASGTGEIDVGRENHETVFTPSPKKPQVFSLEAPVHVKGPFSDPDIGTGDMSIGEILLRSAGRTLTFPIRVFTHERLPEDGSDLLER